ncbi:hypothetical protein CUC08_Gglean003199 [Alternaria sp. MG1]|jgi:hypothetical protein|nr:hypothetical protein CUC08_Gglean003199 [Alternaria sp. MG1]
MSGEVGRATGVGYTPCICVLVQIFMCPINGLENADFIALHIKKFSDDGASPMTSAGLFHIRLETATRSFTIGNGCTAPARRAGYGRATGAPPRQAITGL